MDNITLIGADGKPRPANTDDLLAVLFGFRPSNVAEGCFCGQCDKDDKSSEVKTALFGEDAAHITDTPEVLARLAPYTGPDGKFVDPSTVTESISEDAFVKLTMDALRNGSTPVTFEQLMAISVFFAEIGSFAKSQFEGEIARLTRECDELDAENDKLSDENDSLHARLAEIGSIASDDDDDDDDCDDDCGCDDDDDDALIDELNAGPRPGGGPHGPFCMCADV